MNVIKHRHFLRCCGPAAALFLATGCALQPAEKAAEAPPSELDGMSVRTAAASDRPVQGLDSETLYKLLVAEIAGQREKLDLAVENYRDIARSSRDPAVIERAIRIAVYARDDAAAADIAELWLEVEPDNSDAHQVLAAVAIRAGDVDSAVAHLEAILNSGSGAPGQKLWLIANMLSREDNRETTLAVMERLVADYRDNPDALFAYAHLAVRVNDLERAESLLAQLLELQPDNLNAAMNYISVLQKSGEKQRAIEWFEENLDSYEDNFNLHLMYARLLTDAQRFAAAREEFQALLEKAPENVDVLYALGLLSLQSDRLADAEEHFRQLVEIGQRKPEARYYLGRIAEQRGDLDEAAGYYDDVDSGDNAIDAKIRSALIEHKQGRVAAALARLNAIDASGERERVLLAQAEAEIFMQEKRYDEALAVYNEALEKDAGNTDLLYGRAMLAEKMDKLELLERDLRAIIEQDPDHAQALNALGYTLADRTDRLEEARELIERALEISPNDFYIVDSMGWVLYRMGKLDAAERYLRRALELRNDPEVAAHLGEVLWVKGERDAAREVWETALQSTPDDERLQDVIQRFNP
ncbi:tetratricopeptide (TPR) repeat protein [Methylohalomonas lacus]|uniref:Tetratricopeptide (TPR) repeat protein n=1 Tax=Methylohalomonas lacus TaxID=398773 RepID=A0AAE3L4P8_9GAMM|nr:tetratricopeptide repeat protein [Methylohalomonas lacus]MCS3902082.1 tetratricopeptide (TPR) repeat protein [Methylohalomonas lacus]